MWSGGGFSRVWSSLRWWLLLSTAALVGLLGSAGSRAQLVIEDPSTGLEGRADAAPIRPGALIDELRWGDEQQWIEISGHVNKGILSYDDGRVDETYYLVDNANTSTRLRVVYFNQLSDHLSFHSQFEGEWNPYSTDRVNLTNRSDVDWGKTGWRKGEVWFDSERYGTLWLFQGSTASDGTSEVDLSGTGAIGYSSVSDLAGGQLFRIKGSNTLSTIKVKDAFGNLDGLGRLMRVAYETPSLGGLRLSSSVGTRVTPDRQAGSQWDVAANYEHAVGAFKFEAAAAYAHLLDGDQVNASASMIFPSGMNLTVAGGQRNASGLSRRYVYAKVGYLAEWFEFGRTALAVDAYFGRDFVSGGSKSTSYGVMAVQDIDYSKSEFYIGIRSYRYDDPNASYFSALGILVGYRNRF